MTLIPWRGRNAIAHSFGQFCQPCELHQVCACQEPLGVSGAVCQDPLEPPPGASGQVCQEPLERPGSSGAVCQEPPPLSGHATRSPERLRVAPGTRRLEDLVVGQGAMRIESSMGQRTSLPRLL